jgi:hypothetical protein
VFSPLYYHFLSRFLSYHTMITFNNTHTRSTTTSFFLLTVYFFTMCRKRHDDFRFPVSSFSFSSSTIMFDTRPTSVCFHGRKDDDVTSVKIILLLLLLLTHAIERVRVSKRTCCACLRRAK